MRLALTPEEFGEIPAIEIRGKLRIRATDADAFVAGLPDSVPTVLARREARPSGRPPLAGRR